VTAGKAVIVFACTGTGKAGFPISRDDAEKVPAAGISQTAAVQYMPALRESGATPSTYAGASCNGWEAVKKTALSQEIQKPGF
jgi:hypothetical protein